jgi:hypothetical protein
MKDPNNERIKTMTEPQVPVANNSTEEKKPRFNFHPKIVAGVVTAAVAAGVAFVLHGRTSDSDASDLTDSLTTELFNVTD